MTIKTDIILSAEHLFDHHGFTATGVDKLVEAAGVSSRTFYKHVGSKNALVAAVLDARGKRFFEVTSVESVDGLFGALADWTEANGARGCLFFRADRETGGAVPEVSEAVAAYREGLQRLIGSLVAREGVHGGSDSLAEQLLVLVEGATSAASYRGPSAIHTARAIAALLVKNARTQG